MARPARRPFQTAREPHHDMAAAENRRPMDRETDRRKRGNLMKYVRNVLIVLMAATIVGCGSSASRGPTTAPARRQSRPPKAPPPVPPRVNKPIDAALLESARAELQTASTSSDEYVRAHAIEAMRESMGLAAADSILAAL